MNIGKTHQFPHLSATNNRVTSPPTPYYNCIAWAAGDSNRWWWPDPYNQGYWPPSAQRAATQAAFEQAFATMGFTRCKDAALEINTEKIAIYVDSNNEPTHAARQLSSGKWTSKLGKDVDIEHDHPEDVTGPGYGTVGFYMKRTV